MEEKGEDGEAEWQDGWGLIEAMNENCVKKCAEEGGGREVLKQRDGGKTRVEGRQRKGTMAGALRRGRTKNIDCG